MTTWKRRVVTVLERSLDVSIVRKGRARLLVEQEVLAEFLREFKVDCVFDVGANEGQYAQRLRAIGYRETIVSFEPIPKHAAWLREQSRNDERWFVEELALDERAASVSFNVMARDQFSSLKKPSHDETALFTTMNAVAETIAVEAERLDALFGGYASRLGFRRPFLKMDTQGNDLAVARGAGTCLHEFVGLQSELAFKRLYEHQCDYREALDFYESVGFVLSSLVPNNAGHFPDLIEMDCFMYNPLLRSRHP